MLPSMKCIPQIEPPSLHPKLGVWDSQENLWSVSIKNFPELQSLPNEQNEGVTFILE